MIFPCFLFFKNLYDRFWNYLRLSERKNNYAKIYSRKSSDSLKN